MKKILIICFCLCFQLMVKGQPKPDTLVHFIDNFLISPADIYYDYSDDFKSKIKLLSERNSFYVDYIKSKMGTKREEANISYLNSLRLLNYIANQASYNVLSKELKILYQQSDAIEETFKKADRKNTNVDKEFYIEQRKTQNELIKIQKSIIDVFNDKTNQSLKNILFQRFEKDDYSRQLLYLNYFKRNQINDPELKVILKRSYENKNSFFYRSPILEKY